MTCDECKERVLELIEREALDREGVHEVLARCPECRALFDQMKAGLALADQLPRVEPAAEVDAAILRAARARKSRVMPIKRRWFQSPEWAVAAVALLAVGVGVWAIPRGEEAMPTAELAASEDVDRVERDEAPLEEAEAAPATEVAFADRGAAEEEAPRKAARQATAKSGSRQSRPQAARRSKVEARDANATARVAQAPSAAEPAARAGASAGADLATAEDAEGLREAKKERAPKLSSECARRLARVERRNLDDDPSDVAPEDALAIGECYRAAGDVPKARLWLERAALGEKTKDRATRTLRELETD